MTTLDNQWAARFEPLLDRKTIKKRATVKVPSILGIYDMSTELACARLDGALKTIFYPTAQCIEILHRFVDSAYAHCVITYPNDKAFLNGVYSERSPLPEFSYPILFTGLGGTGKSELMKAFTRIQMEEQRIVVDGDHTEFHLKNSLRASVNVRSSPKNILQALASADGGTGDLVEQCRRKAFRDGVPFLSVDEFQFATSSVRANTQVTQMLLSLAFIGIPWVYSANFSLVRRLMKRPEEDRQRILANYIVLRPDLPDSDDWIQTLQAQRDVAKDILTYDPNKDANELFLYSGGRKRAMKDLLVLALRNEHPKRKTVDLAAIKRAYHSPDFATYREDAEVLATQSIQKCPQPKRLDLWCPLPLPPDTTVTVSEAFTEQRNEKVADEEIRSALNKQEREAIKAMERLHKKTTAKPSGKVVPIRKNLSPSADELKENTNWFKDTL